MESAAPARALARPVIAPNLARRSLTQHRPDASPLANNPIYQIATQEERSPEERAAAIRKFFETPSTKEEARSKIEALNAVAEHLQEVRKAVSKEIMQLTDTEVFGELQRCFGDMNHDLVGFDERLHPLVELVEAVNKLREKDKAVAAFLEIRADRQREIEQAQKVGSLEQDLGRVSDRIDTLNREIDALSIPRGPYGIFGVSKAAQADKLAKERELAEAACELGAIQGQIEVLREPPEEMSQLGDLAAEKAKLREMLDLTTEEHAKRQEELVRAALQFVQTSETRIGAVRGHLGSLGSQVERLVDANGRLSQTYAILSDGVRGAAQDSNLTREAIGKSAEEESALARMAREEKIAVLEDYLARLGTVGAQTFKTYADLAIETVQFRTMRDEVIQQTEKVRMMGTEGVAGVAGRLSTVLQAVNAAALTQSADLAGDTLVKMMQSTDEIAQAETMRVALGGESLNQDVVRAITALEQYGTTVAEATGVTRRIQGEVRDNMAELERTAAELRDRVRESQAVAADAALGSDALPPRAETAADPFAQLGR